MTVWIIEVAAYRSPDIEGRGGLGGSSLGSLEPPFLKLATYQQTLTELTDTHSSSLELRSAVQSRQIAQT